MMLTFSTIDFPLFLIFLRLHHHQLQSNQHTRDLTGSDSQAEPRGPTDSLGDSVSLPSLHFENRIEKMLVSDDQCHRFRKNSGSQVRGAT